MADATPISPTLSPRQWAILALLSLCWGSSFYFVEIALEAVGPLTLVSARLAGGALCLWLVAAVAGLRPPARIGSWAVFFLLGLIANAVPFFLISWGQQSIEAGLASILNATTPLWGMLIAGMLLADEHWTARKLIGAAVGFCGVVLMIGPDLLLHGLAADIPAQLACLAAALCYGMGGALARLLRAVDFHPIIAAAAQLSAAFVLLAPVTILLEAPHAGPMPPAEALAAMAGLALPSTALAYILFFQLLRSNGSGNVLLVTLLVPVWALLLGALLLGEQMTLRQGQGFAVIAVSLALIDGRLLRRAWRSKGANR